MSDAVPTRQTVPVILMLMALLALLGAGVAGEDGAWMAPLRQQYGWDTNELKNKVQQGDVTTYELGTPNYQILNPEDEPEYITEDQPHYRELLRRLTSSANATDTIEVGMPSASASGRGSATAIDDSKPTATGKWEKLKKRSFNQQPQESERQDAVEAVPLDERSRHPRVQVYAGAKPFQTRIANMS
ncbi:uncharacterized protein LOC135435639 [Drosophila montana]|uniref:uncharacterized protein LOC135435639 n=1 Tax=Drosophila montana TaxID=40370 RepID=UPI00313CBC63